MFTYVLVSVSACCLKCAVRVQTKIEKCTQIKHSQPWLPLVQGSSAGEMLTNHSSEATRLLEQMSCQTSLEGAVICTASTILCALCCVNVCLGLLNGCALCEAVCLGMSQPCLLQKVVDLFLHLFVACCAGALESHQFSSLLPEPLKTLLWQRLVLVVTSRALRCRASR